MRMSASLQSRSSHASSSPAARAPGAGHGAELYWSRKNGFFMAGALARLGCAPLLVPGERDTGSSSAMLLLSPPIPGMSSPARARSRAPALLALTLLMAGCALDWNSPERGKVNADGGPADSDGGRDAAGEHDSGAIG